MAARDLIRCLTIGAVLGIAPGAQALTPPAPCAYVSELGRFLGPDETHPRAQSVLPETFQNGIAFFEVTDLRGRGDGSRWAVVQHCPTSRDLLVDFGQNASALRPQLVEMVFGAARYTMQDVADEMQRRGARTELGDVDLGDCACGHQQFFFGG